MRVIDVLFPRFLQYSLSSRSAPSFVLYSSSSASDAPPQDVRAKGNVNPMASAAAKMWGSFFLRILFNCFTAPCAVQKVDDDVYRLP